MQYHFVEFRCLPCERTGTARKSVFDACEDGAAEAVGEEAGVFVVGLGLAAEGGVAAMPETAALLTD